mmetsp:Transcript_47039/g.123443  ORF Transcript_47039/g.123443 Transcript_47039/m.123443 type:complete len:220 (+) Transcript_47039:663-1322(+)
MAPLMKSCPHVSQVVAVIALRYVQQGQPRYGSPSLKLPTPCPGAMPPRESPSERAPLFPRYPPAVLPPLPPPRPRIGGSRVASQAAHLEAVGGLERVHMEQIKASPPPRLSGRSCCNDDRGSDTGATDGLPEEAKRPAPSRLQPVQAAECTGLLVRPQCAHVHGRPLPHATHCTAAAVLRSVHAVHCQLRCSGDGEGNGRAPPAMLGSSGSWQENTVPH